MLKCFNLETKPNDVINLTDDIKQFVAESGIQSGECIVFNPHTTAGLTITSFWDPAGFEDLQDEICLGSDRPLCSKDRRRDGGLHPCGRHRECFARTAPHLSGMG